MPTSPSHVASERREVGAAEPAGLPRWRRWRLGGRRPNAGGRAHPGGAGTLRLLSLPGRSSSQPYMRDFCGALEQNGVDIVDPGEVRSWSFRFDVFHSHFPAHYVNESSLLPAAFWAAMFAGFFALARLLGKRVVQTVHDVVPFVPRHQWLLWPYLRFVQRITNGYVFLSASSQADFYGRFPAQRAKPFLLLGLASAPATLHPPEARLAIRRSLVGDGDVLLLGYLGVLRPRKGLETVSLLPRRLRDGREVRAVVAGETQPSFRAEADAILAQLDPGALVRLDRPILDDELARLIQAVDAVVLPYTIGSNSGMALLVLANHGRLLGSGLPVFAELEARIGAPWVYTFPAEAADPTVALAAALERIGAERPGLEAEDRLARFNAANSFSHGGKLLRDFYGRLSVPR